MRVSLAIALLLGVGSAYAQKGVGAPPDVPKNHWAFTAVNNLFKLGLLDGYPNGTFNGSRPVSRYELAVGMNNLEKAIEAQLDALQPQTTPKKTDLSSLKASLDQLQVQIDAMKSEGQDLQSLKSTMGSLTDHLNQIRSDSQKIKSQLPPKS